MELHIQGLLISLLFHASLISLLLLLPFFHNYPCPPIDVHAYVSSTETNFPPANDSQFQFHFLINPNAGNSTALNPTFAFDSKNNSRLETCQPTNDILFSLMFLLLTSYIFHFLEFWHNSTWIEMRSAMEWTAVHKLLGNYSRASPVVWWRILTYRRRMRWKLDKVLPKGLVDMLTKSKIGANSFKPLLLAPVSTSQASQVFSVQQATKGSNHSNSLAFDIPLPPSVHPSSLYQQTSTSMQQGVKVRSELISSPGSILMTSSLSSSTLQTSSSLSSSSSSSSTLLLPSSALLRAIPTKNETSSEILENPKEPPTGPRDGPASSLMTSSAPSNKNFPGIVSTASPIISHSSSFICSGHCHHDHHQHHYKHQSHRRHHHQDQNNHQHQPQQSGLHFLINPSPPDFQSSGVTTPSDGLDLSHGVNWFLRLARGLLTEKFSQKEFCSAFDHTKFSVTDVTDCLDLSTLTFLTRVKIKKVCSLSSRTSLDEYFQQKSTFINEAILNSEVQDDILPERLERRFDGFLEMTEKMDLVSYNVDPSSNSSAYNIVLNSQNIFVISRNSKPWFSQKLTLWLAAVTVLSWPLRLLINLRTQSVCHFVVKSFGTKKKSDLVDEVTSHSYCSFPKTEKLQTTVEKFESRENGLKASHDETGACKTPQGLCNGLSMHRKTTMSMGNESKEHHVAGEKLKKKLCGKQKEDTEEIPPSYEEVLNCGIAGRCLCDCHKQSSHLAMHSYKPHKDQDESKASAVLNRSIINGERPMPPLGRQMKPMRNGRRIFGRLFQKRVHHIPRTRIVQFMETSL